MWTAAPPLSVNPEQRRTLESWQRAHGTPRQVATRARALLMAADGASNHRIATDLSVAHETVVRWRARFEAAGLESVGQVLSGRGRRPSIPAATVSRILELTLNSTPEGATHWSVRSMAKLVGVSPMSVQRIWRENRLCPHKVSTFKVSKDPKFVEKLTDVVGLYMNPPDKALVLCVDEKPQVQALDRTQPGLPIKRGKAGTMTHDYKRNGTVDLYAALSILDGTVVGQCLPRHRHQEFIRFLRQLDREFPRSLDLHLVLDNSSSHTTPEVWTWLDAHPRFKLHFVPTSCSWLNMVEGVFADLTKKRLQRGAFPSVPDLIAAILEYLDHRNLDPRPFVWKASVDSILAKLRDSNIISGTFH